MPYGTRTTANSDASENSHAESLRTRMWNGFTRTDSSRPRAFWTSLGFLVLAAAGVALEQFSGGSPIGTAPLAALAMIAFGLGDLSGRTKHVVASRCVATTIMLTIIAIWATVGM
jgi:hypothetical protein